MSEATEVVKQMMRRPFDHAIVQDWVDKIVVAATEPIPWCVEHGLPMDEHPAPGTMPRCVWQAKLGGRPCRLEDPPQHFKIGDGA